MDDIVKQAIAKWPNVPDCYGWLGLDARGQWFLRDAATQAAGRFPVSKGSLVEHAKLLAFIGRNYEQDARGCWFFQNGPQRVYVELEASPWVLTVDAQGGATDQTGQAFEADMCWTDETGKVYLSNQSNVGLVRSQDVGLVADGLERGLWPVQECTQLELLTRYNVVLSPFERFGGPLAK